MLFLGTITVTFADGIRKRIKFPRGHTSTVISNSVLREDIDQYLIGARAGQRMKVEITSVEGNAVFQIQRPGNKGMLPGAVLILHSSASRSKPKSLISMT